MKFCAKSLAKVNKYNVINFNGVGLIYTNWKTGSKYQSPVWFKIFRNIVKALLHWTVSGGSCSDGRGNKDIKMVHTCSYDLILSVAPPEVSIKK